MSGFIGYLIGAAIVLPLIIIVWNKYFLKENNNAELFVKPYTVNLVEISTHIPDMKGLPVGEYPYEEKLVNTKIATKNMGRDASNRSRYAFKDIYDNVLKKNIRIVMFDINRSFWYKIGDSTVIMKVNKDDLNNPKYGTKEKPLICFSLKSAHSSLTAIGNNVEDNGKIYKIDTSPEQFEYNVYMYLTYVMPKAEFKERFEKK
ncbi:MAG: hypothetical protein J7577_11515 [Sphingobacteriaceae bacterium]|nr:hypothetical protein [Sphingobacteriaceae bacterium]